MHPRQLHFGSAEYQIASPHKSLKLFLKLDISKAFDSVSWAFLLEILTHLGFGPIWCNLVTNLLKTSSTRVLVNGEPGREIRHQQGLRQGDPLSAHALYLSNGRAEQLVC